jgi:hypothetical protein
MIRCLRLRTHGSTRLALPVQSRSVLARMFVIDCAWLQHASALILYLDHVPVSTFHP